MLTAILLFSFFFSPVEPGSRCVTPGPPLGELAESSAVFSGKVVGRKYADEFIEGEGYIGKRLVVEMKIDRVWKGEVGEKVSMFTSEVQLPNGLTSFMSEDFVFEDDQEYLVYAGGKPDRLSTSACTRSRRLARAEDDLKDLGESHKPKPMKRTSP